MPADALPAPARRVLYREGFQEMGSTPVTLSNFTGLDFNSILAADEAAAQVPITALDNQETALNTSISTLGTIQGDYTTLQSALTALNTSLTIPPTGVSVGSNAPFTAAVTGAPINGSYPVTVTQLASAQILASQGYASDSASVGDGTATITIGGQATPITINSTNDTLSGLAGAINAAGVGVTAQVVNTGAPGAPYRLEISSNSTGAAQSFTINANLSGGTAPDFTDNEIGPTDISDVTGTASATVGGTYTGTLSQGYNFTVITGGTVGVDPITIAWESGSGEAGTVTVPTSYSGQALNVADGLTLKLGNGTLNANDSFGAGAFVPEVSQAQNATLQVGNQIITSSSNQVSNAINGVTLSVSGTGGPSVVTVSPDITTEGNQISAFVNAYNTAVTDTVNNTQALPGQTPPPLADDGGLRLTLFNLQTQLGTLNLSSLGISVNQTTGQLSFNQSSFETSVATNPSQVNTAIGQLYSGLNPVVGEVIAPDTGLTATETTNDQQQIATLSQQINTLTAQEQQQEQSLQAEFAQIQAVVSSYQNLAQLFDSSSSGSSSGSSTPAPGSNLTVSG
jgi:flagellar hook-associated protein 2